MTTIVPTRSATTSDAIPGFGGEVFAPDTAGYEAKRMQALLDEHWGDQEIRMLWGSFGDADMSNERVRRRYYDDDTWRDLQELKRKVDGGDLFHTEFTVQPPGANRRST